MDTTRRPGPPSGDDYRLALLAAADPDPQDAPAVRLAAAVRSLAQAIVGSGAPPDLLDSVAAEVDDLTGRLAGFARSTRFADGHRFGNFINHPMIGPANPCSPPIALRVEGHRLIGEVTFRTPQEGPPGCGYGGYLAAGFDAICLMTAGIEGVGGPTRSLSVRYRRPTPTHTALRYLAQLGEVDARVTRVNGSLVDGDGTVYAEAVAEVATGARIATAGSPPPGRPER